MANPFNTIFRPLVRGFGEAASRAKPFYSGVDQAISAITQNKGTGQQMLAEILKTKGAAKELKDRPVVRAVLNQPKITKEQLQKIATDNPAPQFTEKTRGESGFEAEADKRVAEMKRFRVNEIMDEMNPDSLPQSAEQWKAARLSAESVVKDEEKQIRQNVVEVLHNEGSFYTKFEKWTIPGGTNHREILFQLPDNRAAAKAKQEEIAAAANAKYNDIAAKANAESRLMTTEEVAERLRLEGEIRRPVPNQPYFDNPHYSDPNILAHARVSDRFEPNGDKALHVEELQSDLHQRARDIRKKEIKRLIDSGVSKADANKQVPVEYGYVRGAEKIYTDYLADLELRVKESVKQDMMKEGVPEERALILGNNMAKRLSADPRKLAAYLDEGDKQMALHLDRITERSFLPDAPFKENWHELVMKRLLDDAVKNGYKKVYITPGAEQAKRYNLSKFVDQITARRLDDKYDLHVTGKGGEVIYNGRYQPRITADEMGAIIGKEMAQKIVSNTAAESENRALHVFNDLDLKVGGEGMLGFYDKMVPSFVNDYGAPHNMRMNLHDTQVGGNKYTVFEDSNPSPFSVVREGGSAIASRHGTREEAEAAVAELSTQPLHSIAITPEFEKHVQEKGQRLYQAIPAGIGAGIGALTEEEPAPMKKGGPVSLDAMRLAVMNKKVQHKQYGGALRSGISRIRKNMNPVRGNTIIKEGGGNWIGGDVERGMTGLRRNELSPEDLASARNAITEYKGDPNFTAGQRRRLDEYERDAITNKLIDKQLTKYVKNQMGTKEDPIRLAADAFPEQKAKLLAEKQVQIDKATADMEKAQQSRGFTPEMMTRSQARIRALEKERDLIERRIGLHYEPQGGAVSSAKARQRAGLPVDPTSTTPYGQAWENISDAAIEGAPYRMRLPMVTPETAPDALRELGGEFAVQNPNAMAYSIQGGHLNDVVLGRSLGFNHLMDEMRNATNPESGLPKELLIDAKNLSKWTVPQVTEHVDKINAWRAAQKAEADVVRANNAATVLHKDYPEKGMKWVELKTPEVKLEEGHSLGVPSGFPDLHGVMDTKTGQSVSVGATPEEAMRLYKRQEREGQLADALKYEGEQLQHCVGGYCDDVISGKSRIYSLRDAKGNPHATVEVKPNQHLDYNNWFKRQPEEIQNKIAQRRVKDKNYDVYETPEYLADFAAQPPFINQIKGKGNAAPDEKYLPEIQDFVRSGKWSDVQDLQNTGLTRHKDKYFTETELEDYTNSIINPTKDWYHNSPYFKTYRQLNDNLDSKGDLYKDLNNWSGRVHIPVGTQRYSISDIHGVLSEPRGYDLSTLEDVRDAVNWLKTNQPEIPKHLLPDTPPTMEGMKRGGVVSMDAMRMAVMNKQLRKHHG